MSENNELDNKQRRAMGIILFYPIGILIVGVTLNYYVLEVTPYTVSLPTTESIRALVIAIILLIINHTWIMTSTELVRVRFKLYATPEEWATSGKREEDAPQTGIRELKRRHNAHHNTTENVVYFALLALIFAVSSPTPLAVQTWIIGFSVARPGYTFGYLSGRDGVRGLFMTLGLLAMYGIASHLLISIIL